MFLNEWGVKLELPAETFLKQLVPSGFFQVTQGPSSVDLVDLTVFSSLSLISCCENISYLLE